uniref:Putative secreted protein n=1 Tax=Anopheles marajoara TaxID=58244 RepID=A0A2M4CEZ0_9DIPT
MAGWLSGWRSVTIQCLWTAVHSGCSVRIRSDCARRGYFNFCHSGVHSGGATIESISGSTADRCRSINRAMR